MGISLTLEVIGLSFLSILIMSFALTSLGLIFAWKIESTQGFHSIMNLFLIPPLAFVRCSFSTKQRSSYSWLAYEDQSIDLWGYDSPKISFPQSK